MDLNSNGFDGCQRTEKKVIEGLCLSYDLMRGICMETDQLCDILKPDNDLVAELES